ncbi:hypothetical protein J6590_052547 [Homalodisca vitripennis]|nr:hypothetical protein J6590_052547 [Homalodisca vitripennis]
MFTPTDKVNRSVDKNDFKTDDLIFVKVRGFPFWPAIITAIDKGNKNIIKFKVIFFATNETAVVNKTDICHYNESNELKHSLESVAKKHKDNYKIALDEIKKEFLLQTTISPQLNYQKTPLRKQKINIRYEKKLTLSAPAPPLKPSSKNHCKSVQTEISQVSVEDKLRNSKQTNTDERLSISLAILNNKWLTDDIIQLYYDTLDMSVLRLNKKILLMNAIVTHAIKCLHDSDHLLEPLELQNKSLVFFPIHDLQHKINDEDTGDTQTLYKTEGSHWSLMVFVRSLNKFLYFDSSGIYNKSHAQMIANKTHKFLGVETEVTFQSVAVPQQPNPVDCGVYTIIFTDIILQLAIDDKLDSLDMSCGRLPCTIKQSDIMTKRAQLAYLLHNYTNLQLNPQTTSDMMFKPFPYQPLPASDSQKASMLSQNQGNGDSRLIYYDAWKKEKHPRKVNHTNLPAEVLDFNMSNRYNVLSHSNLEQPQSKNTMEKRKNKTSLKSKNKRQLHISAEPFQEQVKVELYADSQGRGLPEIVGLCSKGKVYMDGLVKPRADISYVYNQASKGQPRPIFLLAGTNNRWTGSLQDIYQEMEIKLLALITKQHVTVASGDGSLTVNNLENPSHDNVTNLETINVLNSNMADVIKNYRHNKKVGFAHSISADFHDKRHMTAGVAVVFKKQFGKPNTAHCITRHLALQDSPNGASVYSLITKSRYYNKPTAQDYNAAFSDLEANFKSRELDHLVCSPIGCVHDRVDLSHFICNIKKFQRKTRARVTIVSCPEESYRTLRNGMSHENFLVQMNNLIYGNSRTSFSSVIFNNSTTNDHAPADQEDKEHNRSSLNVTPLAHVQPTVAASKTSAKVIVVPGDLTYSEALKQSMSECVSSVSPVVINVNKSQEVCTVNEEDLLVNNSLRSECLVDSCNDSDNGSQEEYNRPQSSFLDLGKNRVKIM